MIFSEQMNQRFEERGRQRMYADCQDRDILRSLRGDLRSAVDDDWFKSPTIKKFIVSLFFSPKKHKTPGYELTHFCCNQATMIQRNWLNGKKTISIHFAVATRLRKITNHVTDCDFCV